MSDPIEFVLNYYNISFNFSHDILDNTKVKYLVDQTKKKYIAYWKHSLCNSQKLEFYNTLKTVIHLHRI